MIGGLELVGAILALALFGVPLFVIVGMGTVLGYKLFADDSSIVVLTKMVQDMESMTNPGKSSFLAIPFFIAAGSIMTAGGIAKRLIAIARATVGWLPGGIAIASILACMFFAAISGSSPVTLIAVGAIMFPAMTRSGYPENFAMGLLTTAGSLGCLVPPSLSLIIYSISVSGLKGGGSVEPDVMFLAGIGPALLIAGLLIVYAVVKGMKLPQSKQPFSFAALRESMREGSWAMALPVLILGGIYSGLFTATEASAVAMVYSAFVTLFVYRELTWRQLGATLAEATVLMGSLILIIVLAFGLNSLLALAGADKWLRDSLLEWNLSPFMFLVVVNVILILLGALMDSISATLIFAPLLAPIAIAHGIDPIHFGIIFVVNMEIGYLAPPVATNLFVASAVFKRPFGQVTRAVFPTLGLACLGLLIVMIVPTVSKGFVNWKNGTAFFESFNWSRPSHAAAASGAGGEPVAAGGGEGGGEAGGGGGGGSSLLSKAMAETDDDDDDEDDEDDDEEGQDGGVDGDGGAGGEPEEPEE